MRQNWAGLNTELFLERQAKPWALKGDDKMAENILSEQICVLFCLISKAVVTCPIYIILFKFRSEPNSNLKLIDRKIKS